MLKEKWSRSLLCSGRQISLASKKRAPLAVSHALGEPWSEGACAGQLWAALESLMARSTGYAILVLGPVPAQAASSAVRAFPALRHPPPQASPFSGERPQARGPGLSSRHRPHGPWDCSSTPRALCRPWAVCGWQEAGDIASSGLRT